MMTPPTAIATLEKLLARLPFQLDDVSRANKAYERWKYSGSREDLLVVDLWTYCFVWRNLLVKFGRSTNLNPSDFDMLVATSFDRIIERRHTLRNAHRYASWVSVVCRNVFINYVRKQRKSIPFDENRNTALVTEPEEPQNDVIVLLQVLEKAINRLPRYLQPIAMLRIVKNQSYEEISKQTGKRIEIVRTYMNKVRQRLQGDVKLTLFIQKEFREDTEN